VQQARANLKQGEPRAADATVALQVLDAERNLFQGQLARAKLRLQESLPFVQIYRALGGGWQ